MCWIGQGNVQVLPVTSSGREKTLTEENQQLRSGTAVDVRVSSGMLPKIKSVR